MAFLCFEFFVYLSIPINSTTATAFIRMNKPTVIAVWAESASWRLLIEAIYRQAIVRATRTLYARVQLPSIDTAGL